MEKQLISSKPTPAYDWIVAPLCEGFLILIVCAFSLVARNPLVFSSLGATAYEQIEKSRTKSARPYNVIIGHFSGIAAGFLAVAALGVWHEPVVLAVHQFSVPRMWAATLAVVLTVFFNHLLRAQQPAACSTTLLVALGSFSSWHQAELLIAGVLILGIVGEPLRQLRIRNTDPKMLT